MQGDMIVTSTNWMVDAKEEQKEIESFQKKLAKKLGFLPGKGGMEEMMTKINQSNPQLAEAIKKMQEESKKLSGVPLRAQTVYETKSTATAPGKQEEMKKETEIPTSVGGLMKGLGKKIAKPDKAKSDRNLLMETKTDVTKFEVTSVDAKEFEVPGNYKLQKK
jgi:SOS-response transcriptional repressor LexA